MNESLRRVSGGQYYAPLGRHQDQVGHGKLLTGMQELGSGRSRCFVKAYCLTQSQLVVFYFRWWFSQLCISVITIPLLFSHS